MKKSLVLQVLLCVFSLCLFSQSVTRLADMPERVTNQAITFAEANGKGYVYSFAGLDSTKLFSGIHQKAYKYDVANDTWQTIDPLPSGNGRIAAGASFVKDKIYIIGGYEVNEDDSEISVDLVHVYDPATDSYLPNASPIPVAIDDHVQAVWRDSLIYVVTGWSNTTNVPNVQIYNPSLDEWTAGTPVPDNNTYKVFGSSGVIIGDTIYYAGGVKILGGSFGFSNVLRKGVINPNDPAEIAWTHKLNFQAIGYRMGAATWEESAPIWIGGSEAAYNYDGISYGTGVGVDPYERILQFNPASDKLTETMVNLPIMDSREVAQLDQQSILVCGGISSGQQVSNSTYLIDVNFVSVEEGSIGNPIYSPYPSPSEDLIFINNEATGLTYEIISVKGFSIKSGVYQSSGIDVMSLAAGLYFLNVTDSKGKIIPCGRFIKQ